MSGDVGQRGTMTDTAIRDDVADLHNTSHSHFDLAEEVAVLCLQLILVVTLVSRLHQTLAG
jgi:hypothetical protein